MSNENQELVQYLQDLLDEAQRDDMLECASRAYHEMVGFGAQVTWSQVLEKYEAAFGVTAPEAQPLSKSLLALAA